ncbi:patatin-like phospholipase family protein [Frankia sp. Cpl3]|nr:patatin-like phospholipase family protein [Frankia sp. Cpl3]
MPAKQKKSDRETIGVVISGAAARGAYEAGALAALLPLLNKDKRRLSVFVGTSSGAINAALLAMSAHQTADEAANVLRATWCGLGPRKVWTFPLFALSQLTRTVWNRQVISLLDTSPLRHLVEHDFNHSQVSANIANGLVDALAVTATVCQQNGRGPSSRVFVSGPRSARLPPASGGVQYVPTDVTHRHVLASAAIPSLFPPVEIRESDDDRGWYIDGGVQLNTPIKPALDLGVDRLVVISSHATNRRQRGPTIARRPDAVDAAAQSLHAVLSNSMIEDINNLHRVNYLIGRSRMASVPHGPYRQIPFMVVSPREGQLSTLAHRTFERKYRGPRALFSAPNWVRSTDYQVIGLLDQILFLARKGDGHKELLSYLLFDDDYLIDQFSLGMRRARAAYRCGWQDEP